MDLSVEGLCNQMARSRLLPADTVRALRQRWRGEAGPAADDGDKFGRWLIANQHVTDFQLGLLARGFGDMLFCGEYKLLDRIGQGRMAGIYKAVHHTGQLVAVKILPPSRAANSQLLGRFRREARLALRLHHANVVRAYQRGQTRGGLHFIVLEYLDGETLEEVLKRRQRLPIPEAAHVLVQAFQGLQHLHEEGLVHRDLKPANLMLVPRQEPGQSDTILRATVKILDIGLGRALFDLEEGSDGPAENAELTVEGSLLGTPNYMAPEQARSARLADIRSDCYSLGCVLFEVLTGRPPFPETSFVRQMIRHATEAPQPLKELIGDVPEGLQNVIDSLLAKDPAQRFSTPAQAARALKSFVVAEAAPSASADAGPQLRSYLTWLETAAAEPSDDEQGKLLPGVPAQAMPPAKTNPVGATPAPVSPAQQTPAAAPVPPVLPTPAPSIAQPVAARTAPRPQTMAAVAEPIISRAQRRPAARPGNTRWPQWLQRQGIGPRDLVFAAIGAGSLLVLEALIWLVVSLFR
jgi:serine/threonine protein kinase